MMDCNIGMSDSIKAITEWPTNAELIADAARLGYLNKHYRTLDATFGRGIFWKRWQPLTLITLDMYRGKPMLRGDFTRLPFPDESFGQVVLDGPYKLSGTDQGEGDRYGITSYVRPAERHQLICDGITECERVLREGCLLVKCQDQVSSGDNHWQTDIFTRHAESLGLTKIGALLMMGGREQPEGTRQLHERRNYSTLLIFQKSKGRRMARTKEEPTLDNFGREMKSDSAKTIQPKPATEDLTVIWVGSGPQDYIYVEPTSLFALQRLVQSLIDDPPKSKGGLVERQKRYSVFVRETAQKVIEHKTFPEGGWVTRHVLAFDVVPSEDGQEPAPTPGLLSEVPGAQVLGEDGQWRSAGPPVPNGVAPMPSVDLLGNLAESLTQAKANRVRKTEWIPVFVESEDEDEV